MYVDELVTREETPETLPGFLRQRVRWMQGFIQVFAQWEWTQLPTLGKRVLALYVLGFQFLQAMAGLLAPVGLALALLHKAPVAITLLATVPLAVSLLNVLLDLVMLGQFGRTFGIRVRLRDYVGLVLGAYPFQLVLSAAAVVGDRPVRPRSEQLGEDRAPRRAPRSGGRGRAGAASEEEAA